MISSVTPVTEEIIKALPVLVCAIIISDNKERVMPIAFATGIGFGMFENTVILVQNIESVTIDRAIIRGFSAALMHAVCTVTVGFGNLYPDSSSAIQNLQKQKNCGLINQSAVFLFKVFSHF